MTKSVRSSIFQTSLLKGLQTRWLHFRPQPKSVRSLSHDVEKCHCISFSNPQLGLIAASTPFITGRPVTLFYNQSIYDTGAVGFALKEGPKSRANLRTEFIGLTPISAPMTITRYICPFLHPFLFLSNGCRCEGNIINSLDSLSPTQLLLNAIRQRGMNVDTSGSFKDDETFFLGTTRNGAVRQDFGRHILFLLNARLVDAIEQNHSW